MKLPAKPSFDSFSEFIDTPEDCEPEYLNHNFPGLDSNQLQEIHALKSSIEFSTTGLDETTEITKQSIFDFYYSLKTFCINNGKIPKSLIKAPEAITEIEEFEIHPILVTNFKSLAANEMVTDIGIFRGRLDAPLGLAITPKINSFEGQYFPPLYRFSFYLTPITDGTSFSLQIIQMQGPSKAPSHIPESTQKGINRLKGISAKIDCMNAIHSLLLSTVRSLPFISQMEIHISDSAKRSGASTKVCNFAISQGYSSADNENGPFVKSIERFPSLPEFSQRASSILQ